MSLTNFLSRLVELPILALGVGMLASWVWAIGRLIQGRPFWPEVEPHPGRWRLTTVARAVGLYFLIRLMIEVGFFTIFQPPAGSKLPATTLISLITVINAACLVLIPLGLLRHDRQKLREMVWNGGRVELRVRQGVVTSLLVAPLTYGVQFLAIQIWPPTAHPLGEMIKDGFGPLILAVFSGVFLAPAVEELLFRGILLHWLTPATSLDQVESLEIATLNPGERDLENPYSSPSTDLNRRLENPALSQQREDLKPMPWCHWHSRACMQLNGRPLSRFLSCRWRLGSFGIAPGVSPP